MTKEYKTGRLMVHVDNGTDKGVTFGMGNLVEAVAADQVAKVTEAFSTLVDGTIKEVQATQTFVYRPSVNS